MFQTDGVGDDTCFFHEIQMAPDLMDFLFKTEDSLFFDHKFTPGLTGREKKKALKLLREVFRRLTPCQQECLDLYFFREKSEVEIAVILSRHQTTISQHIRYGLKRLRKLMLVPE